MRNYIIKKGFLWPPGLTSGSHADDDVVVTFLGLNKVLHYLWTHWTHARRVQINRLKLI